MMKPIRRIAALGLALTLVASLAAQTAVDPTTLGPQVGQRSLPFTLPDQTGTPRDFTSLAGPNGTMLVFYRSADW